VVPFLQTFPYMPRLQQGINTAATMPGSRIAQPGTASPAALARGADEDATGQGTGTSIIESSDSSNVTLLTVHLQAAYMGGRLICCCCFDRLGCIVALPASEYLRWFCAGCCCTAKCGWLLLQKAPYNEDGTVYHCLGLLHRFPVPLGDTAGRKLWLHVQHLNFWLRCHRSTSDCEQEHQVGSEHSKPKAVEVKQRSMFSLRYAHCWQDPA
jgi:hypothetical protein